MRKLVIFFIITLTLSLLSKNPSTFRLDRGDTTNHIHGNFILDFRSNPLTPSEIYVATGDGLSIGSNTDGEIKNIEWFNRKVGWSGSSAISFSDDNQTLWMTTGKDSFIVGNGIDDFVSVGTGVYRSDDFGRSWNYFKQPGLTPVQGITYDIACDQLGQVWLASFGQSIQRSSDNGESWETMVPDSLEWEPLSVMNHRVFAVHHSMDKKIIVGSADGINFLEDYNVPDSNYVWKNYQYPQLSGNFVTHINSRSHNERTEIWAATWVAENNSETNGVSYTLDNGENWFKTLLGEKVYSIEFSEDGVFASATNGLWYRRDGEEVFEKFDIKVYDPVSESVIAIERTYTFKEMDGKYFVGTPKGVAISDDRGNSWTLVQGYQSTATEDKEKTYSFPSPFSPSRHDMVKIMFNLESSSRVKCTIFNFANEEVVTLNNGINYSTGDHYLTWDGKDSDGDLVANGPYFYLLEYDGKEEWNKIFIFE